MSKENDSLSKQRLTTSISRRRFLEILARSAAVAGGAGFVISNFDIREACAGHLQTNPGKLIPANAPLARYWISSNKPGVDCLSCHTAGDEFTGDLFDHGDAVVKCTLCAQACVIREGESGGCRARMNVGGTLRSLVYGRPVSVHVDPIEKKPFYHFLPGSSAFSMATAGCPLHCKFCQNWEISQSRPEDFNTNFVPPEAIVRESEKRNAPVIAFTYNEPTVFTEYLTDIARIAREDDIACVMVSCGFMNEEPLAEMCSVLDAIKIDLKGYNKEFYQRVCGAELAPVLRSIKQAARSGIHIEIVNLVVPTLNDSDEMLTELAKWVVDEIGPDVPIHFTRFHPDYQMLNLPPTPVATLEKAYEIAIKEGVHYPFVGNVPGHAGNNTYCPRCGEAVITRKGFFVSDMRIEKGQCTQCGETIAGVWADTPRHEPGDI